MPFYAAFVSPDGSLATLYTFSPLPHDCSSEVSPSAAVPVPSFDSCDTSTPAAEGSSSSDEPKPLLLLASGQMSSGNQGRSIAHTAPTRFSRSSPSTCARPAASTKWWSTRPTSTASTARRWSRRSSTEVCWRMEGGAREGESVQDGTAGRHVADGGVGEERVGLVSPLARGKVRRSALLLFPHSINLTHPMSAETPSKTSRSAFTSSWGSFTTRSGATTLSGTARLARRLSGSSTLPGATTTVSATTIPATSSPSSPPRWRTPTLTSWSRLSGTGNG